MISIALVENVIRETEKAIMIDNGTANVWLPKSQLTIDDKGVIFAKKWLADKLGIGPKFATRVAL